MRPRPVNRRATAPAAAAACSSSKPSKEAAAGGEGRHLLPLGTTRHEQDCARLHPNRWQPPPPLSGRLRRRLPGGTSLRPFWALRCGCVQVPALVNSPSYAPPPYLLMLQMPAAACLRADGRGEILIALCSSGCPASRGFLPRGLSNAGPGGCGELRHGPASESLHGSGEPRKMLRLPCLLSDSIADDLLDRRRTNPSVKGQYRRNRPNNRDERTGAPLLRRNRRTACLRSSARP